MPTPDLGQQIADLRAVVLRANAPEVMTPAEAADFLCVTTERRPQPTDLHQNSRDCLAS